MASETWADWVQKNSIEVEFPEKLKESPWKPTSKDREAAWDFYTELRTRISTQPLHYRHGDEKTALASLAKLFALGRESVKSGGPSCSHFANIVTVLLNREVRPLTAKWHKRAEAGALDFENHRHEFRFELLGLQSTLLKYQKALAVLSENEAFIPGSETGWSAKPVSPPEGETSLADQLKKKLTGKFVWLEVGKSESELKRLFKLESQELRGRRGEQGDGLPDNLVGLAISGGGIRSASFALGATQRLAEAGCLEEVDYLSTVSGGGYFGSFLSCYFDRETLEAKKSSSKSSKDDTPKDEVPGSFQEELRTQAGDSPAVRFIRNRCNYLKLRNFKDLCQLLLVSVYGPWVNGLGLVALVIGLVGVTEYFFGMQLRDPSLNSQFKIPQQLWWGISGLSVLGLYLLSGIWSGETRRSRLTPYFSALTFLLIALLPALLCFERLPDLITGANRFIKYLGLAPWAKQAASSTILSLPIVMTAFRFLSEKRTWLRSLSNLLLLISGPLLLFTVYLILVNKLIHSNNSFLHSLWFYVPVFFFLTAFCNLAVDINSYAPNSYYRDKLARTFLFDKKALKSKESPNSKKLSELRNRNKSLPYHLINATINVPSSDNLELRGRDADFFLFSQKVCGSSVSGFRATADFEKLDKNLDLGTAMSVSGAAASPYMGTATIKGASFLMTVLNIRMGYWLANPKKWQLWSVPGIYYLYREMLGWVDEDRRYLNLSDGGHIENLGVYELLRRRCKIIIVLDGEFDPVLECGSLMKLARLAEIDLGVKIHAEIEDFILQENGFSRSHFAISPVEYPKLEGQTEQGHMGLLIHLKNTMTGSESQVLKDYKKRFPEFPAVTTMDQFFDEEQFESFRSLGYHAAKQALRPEIVGTSNSKLSIQDWAVALAEKLLPEKSFS